MKTYFITITPFLLIGCGTYNHIVERTYLIPIDSPGWIIDDGLKYATDYHAKFICGRETIEFKKIKIYERNVTNSIFWLPIIPSSEENTINERQLVTDIEYSSKLAPCSDSDVKLYANGKTYTPSFSSDASLSRDEITCRYKWPFNYGSVEDINIAFKEYNSCKVPDLSILKSIESSYENHFQAW